MCTEKKKSITTHFESGVEPYLRPIKKTDCAILLNVADVLKFINVNLPPPPNPFLHKPRITSLITQRTEISATWCFQYAIL